MGDLDYILPILSLVITALAVIFGPLLSLHISRKQNETTLAIAKKNIISPIRQKWINELRDILSSITHNCASFWTETSESKREMLHLEVRALRSKLELYINPNESDHLRLLSLVSELEASMFGSEKDDEPQLFFRAQAAMTEQAQKILKTEWERVKNEI